ncbi:MAG: SMP-30/gluconolactonase/LRE family protein [Bacteroidia bacterium]
MKNPFLSVFVVIVANLIMSVSCLYGQQDLSNKLLAKGATLTREATGYSFTEGPAVDPQGNVYFTDQPNDRIIKRALDGNISVYMEKAGRANGLYFDNDGNLLSCSDLENQLWKIAPDQTVTVLIRDFEGKKLNGPNDLWVDPKGGVYLTDPFYKRPWWNRSEKEIEAENVYYLSPDGSSLTLAATGFVRPNGIVGTPDGKKLYVADINDGKTWSFTINPDGTLGGKTLFTSLGSDGMTIDNKGNVYLTGKGVSVFNPAGEKIAQIDVEERWTANVCFGGKKQKTLFITASQSLYSLPMKVRGVR